LSGSVYLLRAIQHKLCSKSGKRRRSNSRDSRWILGSGAGR